tara:strand:+ start:979 stop:1989 length:1011 start_codon:yes stop_codon:yes gene_type:complete
MEKDINNLLKKAITHHQEGDLTQAENLYREILEIQPSHSDANHNIGILAASIGKFEMSVSFFEKAVISDQKKEQYWVSLIGSLIKLGKIHKAREILSAALEEGFNSDKIKHASVILNPSTKLEFFYNYLKSIGVFNSESNNIINGDGEIIPLLTTSFLYWFETKNWRSMKLLEFGSGGSTLYFSKFFKSLTSFETNKDWYEEISSKAPKNVKVIKVKSIIDSLNKNTIKNINNFDAILIDAGENRAKITRWLVDNNFEGIIFFDNSDHYRNSTSLLIGNGFIEIPFFGLKPIEDCVSCTSILIKPSMLKKVSDGDWVSLPKLRKEMSNNIWDDEST